MLEVSNLAYCEKDPCYNDPSGNTLSIIIRNMSESYITAIFTKEEYERALNKQFGFRTRKITETYESLFDSRDNNVSSDDIEERKEKLRSMTSYEGI